MIKEYRVKEKYGIQKYVRLVIDVYVKIHELESYSINAIQLTHATNKLVTTRKGSWKQNCLRQNYSTHLILHF